jgi:hypothetical protein
VTGQSQQLHTTAGVTWSGLQFNWLSSLSQIHRNMFQEKDVATNSFIIQCLFSYHWSNNEVVFMNSYIKYIHVHVLNVPTCVRVRIPQTLFIFMATTLPVRIICIWINTRTNEFQVLLVCKFLHKNEEYFCCLVLFRPIDYMWNHYAFNLKRIHRRMISRE